MDNGVLRLLFLFSFIAVCKVKKTLTSILMINFLFKIFINSFFGNGKSKVFLPLERQIVARKKYLIYLGFLPAGSRH